MMTTGSLEVTYNHADESRLPDDVLEGAAVVMELHRRGVTKQVGERLRIRRQGGYCGLDVWVLLLLYFCAGAGEGLRKFWDKVRPHKRGLGALAGRLRLAAPASMSRALSEVELELLRPQAGWLLTGVADVDGVLRHPAVQTYDAVGRGWHVFDVDPTVTTLRHRALPEHEELPEPRRRSRNTGAPGHSGRKRGDVQFRRMTTQHAGSGVWVGAHLSPGNGEGVPDFEPAVDSVVTTCERIGHPVQRAVARMDGEFGHVPWFTACRERGVPFVTRLNRPALYSDPEVLQLLRSATWYEVPDSGSGPRRAAADLGEITVAAGKRTRRPDGGRYEPVTVRVVAAIFPNDGKAGRGRVIDGWQVELFAVDLPADAWPAPEAVAAYFGRAGQENRFAQEDRELGLDRIVSYELPGQELATLVALSVWNLRVASGLAMEPPPARRPVVEPRRARVDERIPEQWPRDPVIAATLAALDWSTLLARRPGWSHDDATGEVVCEDGRPLMLTTVRPTEHAPGRTGIILRRPKGGCDDCDAGRQCLRSDRPRASKHVEFAINSAVAGRLRERLAAIREQPRAEPTIAPITALPGPLAVADALFLPASARQVFAQMFERATLHVEVELPKPAPPPPRLVAVDVADRRHQRKTWQQNVDRYALPADAVVRVSVAGSQGLREMLGQRRAARRCAA